MADVSVKAGRPPEAVRNSPVQVVLNADDFRTARDVPGGGGPPTDFFADRDDAFRRHKSALLDQIRGLTLAVSSQAAGSVGVAKVTLRRSAWAKSHRPFKALFRSDRTPLLGGEDLGQILVEVTPAALGEVAREIAEAEPETRRREYEGKEVPAPSRRRSETGAIAKIQLFGQTDKRQFSVEEGVAWLQNARTGGAYRVELFEQPPTRELWDRLGPAKRDLFRSFDDGLRAFGETLVLGRVSMRGQIRPSLSMRLVLPERQAKLAFDDPGAGREQVPAPFDPRPQRHAELLRFLDVHPLVRRVSLPSRPVRANAMQGSPRTRPTSVALPPRLPGNYPRVGVIDGGLGDALSEWTVARYGYLSARHRDPRHGSFIGGLLVGGQALNGSGIAPEADGCELVDIDVYPGDDERVFASYFGSEGVLGFLAEIGSAVRECRERHGTRVFNLSINAETPISLDRYSEEAQVLDAIAEENDAIVVVSAGNLTGTRSRPEWARTPAAALAQLAAARDDALWVPSESVRNVCVTALNAPDLAHSVPLAPANYSRRGPGLRAGVKPDFGHVGGSGTHRCSLESGLFSIDHDGTIYSDCGTSYAAPLVAKTLAMLDARIEGDVSRETLLALAVHNASLPQVLQDKLLAGVARQMAGFGCLKSSDEMLSADEHQITLVFASRLRRGQQLAFPFSWPRSLTKDGCCRGSAKLSIVSTPSLDYRFGAEFVRVNVEGALQQYDPGANRGAGGWKGRLKPSYLQDAADRQYEAELIEHGLKWSPVKVYSGQNPRGVGKSSDWRVSVNYLTRAGEDMSEQGVPFTAMLTIADPKGEAPVFNDVRQTLQAVGVRTSDIRTAARINPRV